ncbi:hypothetical protein ACFW04_014766 [Cataglyphis niger]
MSWRVMYFIKENTVEAVPAAWVKDMNGCFWPPYTGLKFKNMIKNCIPSSYDWDLYHSRLIGELYRDLSVAKHKAAQAEETSDLENKKKITSLDSDSNLTFNISYKRKSFNNEVINEESNKENEIINIPTLRKATKENSVVLIISNNVVNVQTDSVPGTSEEEELPNTIKPQEDAVLNYKMAEDLNNLKMHNIMEKEIPTMESLFEKFELPLKSMEDLYNLEIYLENDEKKNKLFGGANPKIMIKRIEWKKLTKNFSNLIISQIIIKSVMALHTSTTASDVESAIKMWLVKANERIQKQQQK